VIDDHCNNEWAAKVGAAWGDFEDSGKAKLEKAAGHTIVKLTPAQIDMWKKAAEPLYTQWIQGAEKSGVKGQQALDELRKEISAKQAN
jgi:TRAP-type transport system periplasmic protein